MIKSTDLLDILLTNRGIVGEKERESFLNPSYETGVYDPFLLQDMQKSVDRILLAIERNEKIVIYGDYDCDGIPGSVVLYDFFSQIGYTHVTNYIPHRHKEGYGLNTSAIEVFAREGVTVLITVDLGITNIKEVELAESLGITCIVTDHHLPLEEIVAGTTVQVLPPAFAIINAKRTGNLYPDAMLCGCGTAWKLVCALVSLGKENKIAAFERIPSGFTKWLLDMVGISTISDMVPLQNENRVLAYYGLIVLRKNRRRGLRALLLKAGLRAELLTEEDIGFGIAPRLNAASRMDIPMDAFTLLSTNDERVAVEKANYLEGLNTVRKDNVAVHMKKAHNKLEGRTDNPVLVLGDTEWSPGVIGLIAGKLADEYKKTVFVWGRGEEEGDYKGSCRSDGFTHLVDLMSAATPDTFIGFGGHEFAGGFSVSHSALFELEEKLLAAYEKTKHVQLEKKNELFVDGELTLSDIVLGTYSIISRLAPFGVGNQRPLFVFKNVCVVSARVFGKSRNHLELILGEGGIQVKAIQFFAGLSTQDAQGNSIELAQDMRVDVTAYIEKNTFAGAREIRLRIHSVVAA
ncbi:MAG: single-stranded-DNA-specific exonuclease, single-stranded-DNA-specific exonuclease [Candidatus Parcubacteria bacterium]|jgi:single-stranded-DNA-specific exonuclease